MKLKYNNKPKCFKTVSRIQDFLFLCFLLVHSHLTAKIDTASHFFYSSFASWFSARVNTKDISDTDKNVKKVKVMTNQIMFANLKRQK